MAKSRHEKWLQASSAQKIQALCFFLPPR